ncbi:MAG: ABC transporter ATP-binding protein [Clostridia bacterium]|nr:ABC transporter ATP-binding protein [Clostridia bacterium]
MCAAVSACIDPIDPIRDSRACTFAGTLNRQIRTYEDGKRHNPRKQARYERELKKAERRQAKGKSWTVPMPGVIELERVRGNLTSLIEDMIDHFRNPPKVTSERRTEIILASIHDSAVGMVTDVTPWEARERALRLMEEVGIPEPEKRYRQYPFEFSGGMRQRIVIAIALAADPDVLICDEPTTALDVTIQAQILELINRIKKERHLSIIFITHDLGVVANMADRIAVMYAGRIVEYGTAEEVFYSPAHPYTWALLSSMPDLDTKDRLEAIPGTPPNMIYPPKGDAFAERNRYAMQIDFEEQPPEFPITPTHWAATWLLHEDAPKVEMPESVRHRIEKMKARMEAQA